MAEQHATTVGVGLRFPKSANVFMSYKRVDRTPVQNLRKHLLAHGIQTWIDVEDLEYGSHTETEIRSAIRQCDGLMLYITKNTLKRGFIWDVEIPTAVTRQVGEPDFKIIPIFREGIKPPLVKRFCEKNAYNFIGEFNGPLSEISDEEIAKKTLRTVWARRLRRLEKAEVDLATYEPWIHFQTFERAPNLPPFGPDLTLDWEQFYGTEGNYDYPNEEVWDALLLPGLRDVKHLLSNHNIKTVHATLQTRLSAALAIGYAVRQTANLRFLFEREGVSNWTVDPLTVDASTETPLKIEYTPADSSTAIIECPLKQPTKSALTRARSSLPLPDQCHHLVFTSVHGVGPMAVASPEEEVAMVRQIRDEMIRLKGLSGVNHFHIFMAGPQELAASLGFHLNTFSNVSIYEYTNNSYVHGYTIK